MSIQFKMVKKAIKELSMMVCHPPTGQVWSRSSINFFLAVFFTCASAVDVYPQTPDKILGQVNIASPNAASLGKFGDIPVNYHTGIPSIGIPLYTIQDGNLSVPISISYHAGGLKVDEPSSSVGAGWALNAGGVITRTVKDKPDERQTSSLNQTMGISPIME
jgi:hypothetical protein